MHYLFDLLFYQPLYNALVWVSAILPSHSLGVAIIILTLVVRLVLFPLQHRVSHTQHKLRELDGTIKAIKEKHAKDSAEQARQIMALYREHGVNPFAGFLVLIIQLPLLLALFWVTKGSFDPQPELLYHFVQPTTINPSLFGLIDVNQNSSIWALLVGLTQYLQTKFTLPPLTANSGRGLKDELNRSLSLQMRYVLPAFVVLVAWHLPIAVSLYWLTSNLFSLAHELFVKWQAARLKTEVQIQRP